MRCLPAVSLLLALFAVAATVWPGCGSSAEEPAKPVRRIDGERAGAAEGGGPVAVLSDAGFFDFTSEGLVLVDFWSPRCPPCRKQGPVVDSLAERYEGRVKVGKIDVSVHSSMARRFRVRYIPTLILFQDGEVVKRFTGFQAEADLASVLDAQLGGR